MLRMKFHEKVLSTKLNSVKGHSLLLICTKNSITIVFASNIIRSVAKLSDRNCYILQELGIIIWMKILSLREKQKLENAVMSSHLYALVSLDQLEKNPTGRRQELKQILVIVVRLRQYGGGNVPRRFSLVY